MRHALTVFPALVDPAQAGTRRRHSDPDDPRPSKTIPASSNLPNHRRTPRALTAPGATHLFEEPGALEQVADLARDRFRRHLSVVRS
jgi:hypothetical protein